MFADAPFSAIKKRCIGMKRIAFCAIVVWLFLFGRYGVPQAMSAPSASLTWQDVMAKLREERANDIAVGDVRFYEKDEKTTHAVVYLNEKILISSHMDSANQTLRDISVIGDIVTDDSAVEGEAERVGGLFGHSAIVVGMLFTDDLSELDQISDAVRNLLDALRRGTATTAQPVRLQRANGEVACRVSEKTFRMAITFLPR